MGTPELDGPSAIRLAREFDFDGIDLRVSDNQGELTLQSTDSEIKEIQSSLNGEGIELVSLFAYNERGNDDDGSWEAMEDSLFNHLELASSLGCPAVRMFGGDPQKANDTDEHIKRTAEVLHHVFSRHDSDIQIRLQNHAGSFLFTQGQQLFHLVDNQRFNQVFSPDHCYLMGEDLDEIFPVAKNSSGQIFISDVLKNDTERGFTRTEIGEGEVPLLKSIHCLGDDFDGYLTLKWEKIWNAYLANANEAFPRFMNWMSEHHFK